MNIISRITSRSLLQETDSRVLAVEKSSRIRYLVSNPFVTVLIHCVGWRTNWPFTATTNQEFVWQVLFSLLFVPSVLLTSPPPLLCRNLTFTPHPPKLWPPSLCVFINWRIWRSKEILSQWEGVSKWRSNISVLFYLESKSNKAQ